MKPTEIRAELLGQHAALCSLFDEACQATEAWARGRFGSDAARAAVVRLAGNLRRHNRREEELLRDLIPAVDPWGPARAEILSEEHVKEHHDLYAALTHATAAGDPEVTAALMRELRARMRAHMAREERDFLGEDALRDDDVSIDSFGG